MVDMDYEILPIFIQTKIVYDALWSVMVEHDHIICCSFYKNNYFRLTPIWHTVGAFEDFSMLIQDIQN